jgi:5-hydroxyisourate hydrolase-like protein (transthyretin family)
MIMKEMEGEPVGWRLEHLGAASDKATIEETAQKIVLRTYQLSLLVGKYFKCLRKGNDLSFFQNAITVLTNINKKHDHLLRL